MSNQESLFPHGGLAVGLKRVTRKIFGLAKSRKPVPGTAEGSNPKSAKHRANRFLQPLQFCSPRIII